MQSQGGRRDKSCVLYVFEIVQEQMLTVLFEICGQGLAYCMYDHPLCLVHANFNLAQLVLGATTLQQIQSLTGVSKHASAPPAQNNSCCCLCHVCASVNTSQAVLQAVN